MPPRMTPSSASSGPKRRGITSEKNNLPNKRARRVLSKSEQDDSSSESGDSDTKTIDPSNEAQLWEPTPPTSVKIQDLDLDKSYVDEIETAHFQRGPSKTQKRWSHKGGRPLLDWKQLPKGWNAREPDLDPLDIDSQIARCHERIEDNIMPFIFQERLKEYELGKAAREEMAVGEPKGLSWAVIQRIDTLKLAQTHLREQGDRYDQLKNLEAILTAYRRRKLDWNDDLVTYWSYGKQLCQPRPFRWDEFEAINSAHQGTKSFWTEGLRRPQGSVEMASIRVLPYELNPDLHFINVAVRFPGIHHWAELHCLHDTGADTMSIFEGDLPRIMGPFRAPMVTDPPLIGTDIIRTAHGPAFTTNITRVEVTILDDKGRFMVPWALVECQVKPGSYTPGRHAYRVDGPALKSLLYQAYAPDGRNLLYLANQKHSLRLPRFNLNAKRPTPRPPSWKAAPAGTTLALPPMPYMMAGNGKNYPRRARGARN